MRISELRITDWGFRIAVLKGVRCQLSVVRCIRKEKFSWIPQSEIRNPQLKQSAIETIRNREGYAFPVP
ncbi:MAG TPA: hypothetical protein VGQ81_03105 [Acidobacteriota bacterium]|jgi:hypothetical protein|nr:hypothetical protein [Acidobacteriota bacterium]